MPPIPPSNPSFAGLRRIFDLPQWRKDLIPRLINMIYHQPAWGKESERTPFQPVPSFARLHRLFDLPTLGSLLLKLINVTHHQPSRDGDGFGPSK